MNGSSFDARSREDAEMWCNRCKTRHGVVWYAPSDLWNATMREGDRAKPDEFGFCCPTCFMQLADERGVGNRIWVIAPDPARGPYPTLDSLLQDGSDVRVRAVRRAINLGRSAEYVKQPPESIWDDALTALTGLARGTETAT